MRDGDASNPINWPAPRITQCHNGSISIEWRWPDKIFGFTIEQDPAESGWYLAFHPDSGRSGESGSILQDGVMKLRQALRNTGLLAHAGGCKVLGCEAEVVDSGYRCFDGHVQHEPFFIPETIRVEVPDNCKLFINGKPADADTEIGLGDLISVRVDDEKRCGEVLKIGRS